MLPEASQLRQITLTEDKSRGGNIHLPSEKTFSIGQILTPRHVSESTLRTFLSATGAESLDMISELLEQSRYDRRRIETLEHEVSRLRDLIGLNRPAPRALSKARAKKEIRAYFTEHDGEKIYASDISDGLNLEYDLVLMVINVLEEESKMDASVLEEALDTRSEFMLTDLDLDAWEAPDLATSAIQPSDRVIDLRSKAAFDAWHYPEALFLDFPNAIRAYASFDAGHRYVLYCEFGLKSAHLADLMRRAGLNAQHVSGGLREVKQLAGD